MSAPRFPRLSFLDRFQKVARSVSRSKIEGLSVAEVEAFGDLLNAAARKGRNRFDFEDVRAALEPVDPVEEATAEAPAARSEPASPEVIPFRSSRRPAGAFGEGYEAGKAAAEAQLNDFVSEAVEEAVEAAEERHTATLLSTIEALETAHAEARLAAFARGRAEVIGEASTVAARPAAEIEELRREIEALKGELAERDATIVQLSGALSTVPTVGTIALADDDLARTIKDEIRTLSGELMSLPWDSVAASRRRSRINRLKHDLGKIEGGAVHEFDEVLSAVANELARARAKFPGENVTFAALVEEVGELATALFSEEAAAVRAEAVQVAVMALRVILDGDHTFAAWRRDRDLDPLADSA